MELFFDFSPAFAWKNVKNRLQMKIQDWIGVAEHSSSSAHHRHSCSHSCHRVLELIEKNLNLLIDIIIVVVVIFVIVLVLPVVVVVGNVHDQLQQQHDATEGTENGGSG